MFSKTSLQHVKKIGDQLAVQVWMDYAPNMPPEYWREVLVERGVGERKRDGTVRLNRRGRRLRAEIVAARKDDVPTALAEGRSENGSAGHAAGAAAAFPRSDSESRPGTISIMAGLRSPRPWREILARCDGTTDFEQWEPRSRIAR